MTSNIVNESISACAWATSKFLLFSENVFSPLIYYSHLAPLILLIIFGTFIFLSGKNKIINQVLTFICLLLSIWIFGDLVLWATEKPQMTMFFWSIVNLVEPIIYGALAYFVYLFIEKKDLSFWKKFLIIIPLLPTILLTPTHFAILGIDLTNCDREVVEGILVYYGYIVEIIFSLWIIVFGIKSYLVRKNPSEKKQVVLVTVGAVLFLLTFALGNIIGSLFVDWTIGQYGIFGIPIFIGFLSYLIVKFKAFNSKVIGTQVLILSILIALVSILFINEINLIKIIIVVTAVLISLIGIMLILSVRKEIKAKEQIAELAGTLEKANVRLKELDQQKSEFISLASHQIRGPLASIKGYVSMILEGDFGKITDQLKETMNTIFTSTQSLVVLVGDFLDVSRIEQGRMKYDFSDFSLEDLAKTAVREIAPTVEVKNLKLSFIDAPKADYMVRADEGKIKQIILNIIDNSVKYTKEGGIQIGLDRKNNKIHLFVKDTGVGIAPEVLPRLFEKFTRGPDASKTNILGTGLGLYVAKKMIEAQYGRIWAESEGAGKGSVFHIELNAKNLDTKTEMESSVKNFATDL